MADQKLDIPDSHPEFTMNVGKDITGGKGLIKEETPASKTERIQRERLKAIEHLKKIADGNQTTVNSALIDIYGYDKEKIEPQSETSKQQLIRAEIATDLLYRELYEEDGTPSEYAGQNNMEGVDPNEYQILGTGWDNTKAELKKKVPEPTITNPGEDYAGNILTKQADKTAKENSKDPVERYAAKFGEKSIIALPFKIQTGYNIEVKYVPDFQQPYGGGEFTDRLVYLKV